MNMKYVQKKRGISLRDDDFTKFKKGDLVDFYTEAPLFSNASSRYANPGIVINVKLRASPPGQALCASNLVYWNDGTFTREHDTYLRHTKERKVV